MDQSNSQATQTVQETLNKLNNQWDTISTDETSTQQLQDFNDYATQLLDLYSPKMRYPHLSVSMRADDPPTREINQIAVDVAALAYFMVDKNIWLPQSEKFLPFLRLTVESLFQREFKNSLEKDSRREDLPEEELTFDYEEIIKNFPIIFYFTKNGDKSIPILMDEFERKVRFDASNKLKNIERRLWCAALIASILINESEYRPEEITPEIWHRIASETWRDLSNHMTDDDDKFQEAATLVFNGRIPFYSALLGAYPPDLAQYPLAKRSDEEHEKIMEYVPPQ